MSPSAVPQSASLFSPFRRYLFARAASTFAFQMTAVAVAWQIYDLTRNPLDLGLVGLVQFIPSILLALYVGHVADRHDRRRVVFLAETVEALALCGLLALSLLGAVDRCTILLFMFCIGVARCFEYTTLQTIIPSLVEQEFLPRAMAMNASVRQAATIAGPAVGGLLYLLGPAAVYGLAALLFLASALTIAGLAVRPRTLPAASGGLAELLAGISFVRRHPVVLGAISLDLFAVLFGGATALLPIYARDILHTGPEGLGILRAAPAVGALACSLYLSRWPLQRRVGRVLFSAVAAFGLLTVVFALSRSMALSCLALALMGWSDMVSVVIRASLVQLETPDEMRGRVSAVNAAFIGTSNQLGEFESGLTAAWFGVVPAAVLGGVGTLIVCMAWLKLFPQLLRRERL